MLQLDLLTWEPPRKFIPFPLANRIGKVRRVAEVLEGKRGRDATAYWNQQVRNLVEHLEGIGCNANEVRAQVHQFHDAVQAELVRRSYAPRTASGSHDPRGAA